MALTTDQRSSIILAIAAQVSKHPEMGVQGFFREHGLDTAEITPGELESIRKGVKSVLQALSSQSGSSSGHVAHKPLQIIEFQEKHSTRRFAFRTEADKSRVAYRMLKEWWELGYVCATEEDIEEEFKNKKSRILAQAHVEDRLTDEEVEGLPPAIRDAVRDKLAGIRRKIDIMESHKRQDLMLTRGIQRVTEVSEDEAIKMTIKLRSGRVENAPLYYLDLVSDGEYMRYTIEDVEEVSKQEF